LKYTINECSYLHARNVTFSTLVTCYYPRLGFPYYNLPNNQRETHLIPHMGTVWICGLGPGNGSPVPMYLCSCNRVKHVNILSSSSSICVILGLFRVCIISEWKSFIGVWLALMGVYVLIERGVTFAYNFSTSILHNHCHGMFYICYTHKYNIYNQINNKKDHKW
jgi:hypothetical protein